jgi:Spy/CpxP family protein refolding chaperone
MRYSKFISLAASAMMLLAIAGNCYAQGHMRPGRLPRGEGLGKQKPSQPNHRPSDAKPDRRPKTERVERPKLPPAQQQRMRAEILRQIRLTPEQQMRLMEIRRSHEDELISAGRRVRQARQALEQAIMNEHYDEALIRRRAEELAAAQAESIKLQAQIRAEVRKVLTADQVRRYVELEREFRRRQREMRQNKLQEQTQSR